MRTRRSTPGIRTTLAALALVTCPALLWAQESGPDRASSSDASTPTDTAGTDPQADKRAEAFEVLVAAGTVAEDRAEAARALVADSSTEAAGFVLAALVAGAPGGPAVVQAVLHSELPPEWLRAGLTDIASGEAGPGRADALVALTRWHDLSTVRLIVDRLAAEPLLSVAERRAVYSALHLALATDAPSRPADTPSAWASWIADWESRGQEAWAEALAGRQHAVAREQAQGLDAATTELRGAYRRLYALLPDEERSPFIAGLIGSETPGVSSLGYDLASQSLLNARPLGPEVLQAAFRSGLSDDIARRSQAASLVARMGVAGDSEATEALRDWVAREEAPAVAARLLRTISTAPELVTPATIARTVQWASGADPAAASAALESALVFIQDDRLTEDQRDQLRRAAERQLAGSPTPAAVRVIGALGDPALLVPSLQSSDVAVVNTAARVLAGKPGFAREVVEAARATDALFGVAATALLTNGPTAQGVRTLLTLPAPSAGERAALLAAHFRAMPLSEQEVAAGLLDAPSLRAACLAHIGVEGFFTPLAEDDYPRAAALAGMLAQTHLELRDPGAAVSGLQFLPPGMQSVESASLKIHALLWLGRMDEARAIADEHQEAGVGPWLDGLRDALALEHAAEIARLIQEAHGPTLTEQERIRYQALVGRLPAAEAPQGEDAQPASVPESPTPGSDG